MTTLLGVPRLLSNSRRGQPKRLVPLKLSWHPSLVYMPNIRLVLTLCSRPLEQLHFQNTVAVKEKIEILRSRITTLERLFEQPTSDEKEIKLREVLSMYASGPRSDPMLIPS